MQPLSSRWRTWQAGTPSGPRFTELPLRAELLGAEQLALLARALATGHGAGAQRRPNGLLPRLDENERALRSFNRATLSVGAGRRITPASERLLENFYLIEEQIQIARRHLPRGYARGLPRLAHGPSAGLPRVYDLVLEFISHVDAQIDSGPLTAFVAAYQTVRSLELGELWAIPIMLRLGLIENLRRVTARLIGARKERDLADHWADRLRKMAELSPSRLVIVVADMAKADLPLTRSFVAEFCQQLSRQSPVLHVARAWLEQRLAEEGRSIEMLVHQESQHQAADEVSVSHSIASLRFLSATDWKAFVETLSEVHAVLCGDPADVYRAMDFATRDRYRHEVEFLSRRSGLDEGDVARRAVQLAADEAWRKGSDARSAHVGFFLVGPGQAPLGRLLRVRWPWRTRVERGIRRAPLVFFVGGVVLLALLGGLGFLWQAREAGVSGAARVPLALLFLLSAGQPAVAVMNWLATLLVRPRRLPRLDSRDGIPADQRTMVVVPTILKSPDGIDRLLETLEVHYLSNSDPHLHFALLTDLRDAATEHLPEDEALLRRVRAGIRRLNRRHRRANATVFFLFHRPRRWNPGEGVWMGYERKRGKLEEFNAVLRGSGQDRFSEIVGTEGVLPEIKYVITLDGDTRLPRDAARLLVSTMAHPLNRPEFDPVRGVVAEGYGILQPRVGVSLAGARRSWFVRLFAAEPGIDPYTREVSDVYQDLFEEGSYIGKGIYDVDAFRSSLRGRIPENAVLSHDLLEACHARSALVSDIEIHEEYPSRYDVDVARRRRWMRGDWQIATWLLPRVPGADGRWIANPLSALSRWKIFDNLRRSVVPVALLLFLLGSWLADPGLAGRSVLLVAATLALPAVLAGLFGIFGKSSDVPWATHVRTLGGSGGRQLGRLLLALAFLPYEAFLSVEAIGRTLARLAVTRRHLLEWRTSDDAERSTSATMADFAAAMWMAPAAAAVGGALLWPMAASDLPYVLPVLGLWLLAPTIAWRMSQPVLARDPPLSPEQVSFLGRTARRTWSYFETFVTAQENGLPPDNVQEAPVPRIASRTSPTNMGLALLANLAARDLGYLSAGGLLRRTRDALATMRGLERYRGHFYNWYETRTLQPLLPLYVSSVDSGNLAGHLLTLASGLREEAGRRLHGPQGFSGLRDTVDVLRELAPANPAVAALAMTLDAPPAGLRAALVWWESAAARAAGLSAALANETGELREWARALQRNCEEQAEDLRFTAPWLALPLPGHGGRASGSTRAAVGRRLRLQEALAALDRPPTLAEIAKFGESLCPALDAAARETPPEAAPAWDEETSALTALAAALREAGRRAEERLRAWETLARESDELAAMDFGFLFDPARNLFCIGFNVPECRRDAGFYDLLASEARLCSYVAIALGQVPQDHWFSLGRLLVAEGGDPVLISWSGSMFEYLMPLLVMPNYEHTLLDHTCRAAVRRQIAYGRLRGVPWGISESGYNLTDVHLNYQYRAFGVPGLGLKRGLADDLVIAPYATVMALLIAPREACENLQRLAGEGRVGAQGFFEAVDYTPARLPPDERSVTVRSFMAHHQGMSLLALVSRLRGSPMQRRFMSSPLLRTAELLLQERVPKTAAGVFVEDLTLADARAPADEAESGRRICTNPASPAPAVHLLSNGRYHVAISSAGGGYSRWRDLAVTRWREDATRDCWGMFVFLRDLADGEFWSAAFQPATCATEGYEAIFTQAGAEFRHRHRDLDIRTEICVSPEDDVELRRITVTNRSAETRVIEVTSYAEVVLAAQAADEAHPAFGNLFVQTEFARPLSALLCTRRARSAEESPPWLVHLMAAQAGDPGEVSCETDRSRFVGRGRSLARPAALQEGAALSGTVGSVLDPIVSLRRVLTLAPHGTGGFTLMLGAGDGRTAVEGLAEKYQGARMADRAFDLAWTQSQVTLRHLNASDAQAQRFDRLAGALVFADRELRASPALLRGNRRGQSGLWSHGVSGDAPIVLLRCGNPARTELVSEVLRAHAYWRLKGLAVDLVILTEEDSVYHQSLHERVLLLIAAGVEAQQLDKPGGLFVRRFEQIPAEDRGLLYAAARIVLDDGEGTLAEQIEARGVLEPTVPALVPGRAALPEVAKALPPRELIFCNGLGGFTRDGHEYVITLRPGEATPAPWVNVLANPTFGTLVSESGAGYSWVENAHEFRLTPWSNDPVQDTPGEALYIRDEESGLFWSPTPAPARGATPYVVRHGFGYSVFEHTEQEIVSELWIYVAMDAPVKFAVLKIRNLSGRPRRISVTGYWEWVLGDLRAKSLLHVQTEVDPETGALLARNPYNTAFPGRIAFVDVSDENRTITGDRREFLGRNGGLARPAALGRVRLSGRTGAGLDPCGGVQVAFALEAGQERETAFRLGVGRSAADVQDLLRRFRRPGAGRAALEGVWAHWNRTLGAVNVDTPDPAVNVLANGWLVYQTLSARVWGRTGFYQSGGAYGFRDQLQDVMALVHAEPGLTRAHLLRAAARQFPEGDVQHWWHPPTGAGVRTRFSDDYLWLPYATCRYVACVADTGVLDERVPFVEGRAVRPEEEGYYDLPGRSEESATLYGHCVRAIERGLRFGAHGLPLIGCGDWNDGLNRVGHEGRGESVWLAFFLHDVLTQFAALARSRADATFAERCLSEARELQRNIEQHGWDGEWYRRAYFDHGEPLGSRLNPECRIDSLPQSWSVISGAGDPVRSRQAMEAVNEHLVRRAAGLVQLFDPPFDRSAMNPGYIKGYIPGVRENGGQYTHAAIWAAMAFALQGDSGRAWELFALLNPVGHGGSAAGIATYKVEPYVVAADVYAVAPHIGRGGWTWYTGAAGWMYRLVVETLLGIHLEGDRLRLEPRMPGNWTSYKIHYRYRQTVYHITISRAAPDEAATGTVLTLDGGVVPGSTCPLRDDRREHLVELRVR